MTAAKAAAAEPQATVAGVRSHVNAGNIETARPLYDELLARLGPTTDVLVTEGLLHEAEGDLEAALASFGRVLASAPGSIHANARSAHVLMRLERPIEAEAAALTTLALDEANLTGLTVLAYAYDKTGRSDQGLDVVYRLARIPNAPASTVLAALDQLAAAGRSTEVLRVLDARGDGLFPRRACSHRVEALLELDRQRDALAGVLIGYAAGAVQPRDMIDRLITRRALSVAAGFVQQALAGAPGAARFRDIVVNAARQTCDGATLEASPFEFADAAHALEMLLPDNENATGAVARSASYLVTLARAHFAQRDYSAATDHLIHAGRLAPTDRAILELLADAAVRAGRSDRYVDTLLRIHRSHPDAHSFTAALDGAITEGLWDTIAELILESDRQAVPDRPETGRTIAGFRLRLQRRLEDFLREGDFEAGLGMVAGLWRCSDVTDWPQGLVRRLLAASKRLLRNQRTSTADATANRMCLMYLTIDPEDLDVNRLLARLHLRHRRPREAIEILTRIVRGDPHLARDWLDLAMARHDMGETAERDVCIARALVIDPAISLPKILEGFRARMLAA